MHPDKTTRAEGADASFCAFWMKACNHFPTSSGTTISLQHGSTRQWYGVRGDWVASSTDARRFSSNMDAIIYSSLLNLRGVKVVGLDDAGRQVYDFGVEELAAEVTREWSKQPGPTRRWIE